MLKSIGWSVLFSHLHSVCFYGQSPAPGKGVLWESLSSFLFVLFPSLKRFRLGCIAVDMTFQTLHSSFLWLEAFDQAGLEAMISLPLFLSVVWTFASTARKHSLPFDASTCTYLSCLNTAWHVCLEDIL